jgi:hypothetical protein
MLDAMSLLPGAIACEPPVGILPSNSCFAKTHVEVHRPLVEGEFAKSHPPPRAARWQPVARGSIQFASFVSTPGSPCGS